MEIPKEVFLSKVKNEGLNAELAKTGDPHVMIKKLDSMLVIFTEQIRDARLLTNPAQADVPLEWVNHMEFIEIQWGLWSHEFNKEFRKRIKEADLFKTAEKMCEVKLLNYVFLYWWRCFDYFNLINKNNIIMSGVQLNQIIDLKKEIITRMKDTKPEYYQKMLDKEKEK